jgi:hypothetical protein
MARTKNRLVALALLAVLAIASLSVGYAGWTKTLTINGTASTGKLDVQFTAYSAVPTHTSGPYGIETCSVAPAAEDGAHNLVVTVANLYPGFTCTINYTMTNMGTLPAKNSNSIDFSALTAQGISVSSNDPGEGGVFQPAGSSGDSYNYQIVLTATDNTTQGAGPLSFNLTFTESQP